MARHSMRLVTGTVWVAICALILLLVFAFGPTLLGYETMIVSSGSMGKAMPVGSVAQTKLEPVRSIAVGDIVSFRLPTANIPTTHRVIAITEKSDSLVLTTKGDANATADAEPVIVKQTGSIQRVERVVPYAGSVVHIARAPAGMIVLFAFPILGLVFDRKKRPVVAPQQMPAPGIPSHTFSIALASTASTTYASPQPLRRRQSQARALKRSNS